MSSKPLGSSSSRAEVTNISSHGLWLLASGSEMFLAFEDFPWFKDAPVAKILNVVEPRPDHFFWPDLDVDLTAEIIQHPEKYPLKASSS